MKYSTRYDYSTEVLTEVANFCHHWDKNDRTQNAREEKILYNERQLFLQYMFIHQAPDPLRPSEDLIERWLSPADGFHIYDLRLVLLERLARFTKVPVKHRIFQKHSPVKETFFWHRYHGKIFKKSRDVFEKITTKDIVESELKLWAFYHAMDIYRGQGDHDATDFFEESHHQVVQMVSGMTKDTAIRVLDIGCGDGRLLMEFRKNFPNAELFATNFFETTGLAPALLKDPKFKLQVCTLEEMDYPENFFDVIVSTEVIEHLRIPQDMVEKIKKHLKPKGIFIVTAPSVHTRFLSPNPVTYLEGILSTVVEKILPPFHQLYEAMTDLTIVHHAFSRGDFLRMFGKEFSDYRVMTLRFTHLRKFRLQNIAGRIPLLRNFGGLMVAVGRKS